MSEPRLAREADLEAVVALTGSAYAVYTERFGAPPLPVTEDYRPRIAAGEVWLLPDGADLAGLIVLERHPDHALVYSVAVDPARQGRGVGKRLLSFAEATARAWGMTAIRLYTNALMDRNIALYTSLGYRETGRRGHALRPTFTLVDMEKPLTAPR